MRRATTSMSLVRSFEESGTSWNSQRSNMYTSEKSTDATSQENEARSYELTGLGGSLVSVAFMRILSWWRRTRISTSLDPFTTTSIYSSRSGLGRPDAITR
jgi:hypothetical protein